MMTCSMSPSSHYQLESKFPVPGLSDMKSYHSVILASISLRKATSLGDESDDARESTLKALLLASIQIMNSEYVLGMTLI